MYEKDATQSLPLEGISTFSFFTHLAARVDLLYNMLGIHKETALNELHPEGRWM